MASELLSHPMRLSEAVVEGKGEGKVESIGEVVDVEKKGRMRQKSVSETIEETFRYPQTTNHLLVHLHPQLVLAC